MSVTSPRRAAPCAIKHALPSLLIEPPAPSEMHLVSGPSDFVKMVISAVCFMMALSQPQPVRRLRRA
jgi:hypothetical protein